MTLLSRSKIDHSMVTISCDLCYLPLLITNREDVIAGLGWQLTARGHALDACPQCQELRSHLPRRSECDDPLPADGGRLPDLCVVGAAKSGTTSLHYYLGQHPDIGMAELKELRFFADPDNDGWERRYRGLFPSGKRLVGESSTMYTRAPALPGVPERMRAMVPDARLIYLVRDPAERALASYVEERFHGLEPRTAEEAFADLDDPYNPYLSASRYAEQLSLFLEHFPAEQILVLPLEDLDQRAEETMRRVFAFLGVDPDFPVDLTVRFNERAEKRELVGAADSMRRSVIGRAYRRIPYERRRRFSAAARRLITRRIARPELSAEHMDRLRAVLAPDARRFQELTGLTPAWMERYLVPQTS